MEKDYEGLIPGKTAVRLGGGDTLPWPQVLCNLDGRSNIHHPSQTLPGQLHR